MKASNQIRIDYPDDDVENRVSRFLHSRHFPAFRNLSIVVRHGAVTVTGEVHSYYEKQVAMTSCQHVAGVLSLVDEIAVRNTVSSSVSDETPGTAFEN
ncbi:MAG: BON domain-containing protein [Mariniblastus sp.]